MRSIFVKQQVDINQLKNQMLTELRRLHNVLRGNPYRRQPRAHQAEKSSISRNFLEITKILESFGISVDIKQKIAKISKNSGEFIINLLEGTVNFIPIICLKCNNQRNCNSQRKLCIIGDSQGWANFNLSPMDMLILSKSYAILYDQLPDHVLNQIQVKSYCLNQNPKISPLEERVLQALRCNENSQQNKNFVYTQAPAVQGLNPPPKVPNLNLRFDKDLLQKKHLSNHSSIFQLRNEMLIELKRLQHIMQTSKKAKYFS